VAKVRVVQVLELGVETEVEVISTMVEPVCEEPVEEAAACCEEKPAESEAEAPCEEKPVEKTGAEAPCEREEEQEEQEAVD